MGEARTALRFEGLDTVALLELVRDGDQDAYGELYARYHDFAHKVARRASRRHADDLVAESFRRVLTAISHGAGPTQGFGPYLAATIRSAAAGLAAPYQEVELDVSQVLADDDGDVDPRVSTAFLSLPEQWQNALWYSDVEGLSPRHAAPLLGLASANAFSALRKRARAGLRSAYLTQVVDEACNEHVRRHLELLMAGEATAETVDQIVDDHLKECDECAAIAWRVGAVTGNKLGLALAPALLAFHGFAVSGSLLPAGLGLPWFLGWLRRIPKSMAAAGGTVVATGLAIAAVAVGSSLGGGNESAPVATPVVVPAATVSTTATTLPPPTTVRRTTTSTTSTSTTSTSTTTSSTSTTTTTTEPPRVVVPPPPRPPPAPPTTTTTVPETTTTSTTTATAPPTTTGTTTTSTSTTTTTVPPTTTSTSTTVAPTTTSTTTTTTTPPQPTASWSDGARGVTWMKLTVQNPSGEQALVELSGYENLMFDVEVDMSCDAGTASCLVPEGVSTASVEVKSLTWPVTATVSNP